MSAHDDKFSAYVPVALLGKYLYLLFNDDSTKSPKRVPVLSLRNGIAFVSGFRMLDANIPRASTLKGNVSSYKRKISLAWFLENV